MTGEAWVFGYGSLVAPDSIATTIGRPVNRADGYVRSEGCGMVVLKRQDDAEAAGLPIDALILGTAVNHDGHSAGLTVPSGIAQQQVLRTALAAAGVEHPQGSRIHRDMFLQVVLDQVVAETIPGLFLLDFPAGHRGFEGIPAFDQLQRAAEIDLAGVQRLADVNSTSTLGTLPIMKHHKLTVPSQTDGIFPVIRKNKVQKSYVSLVCWLVLRVGRFLVLVGPVCSSVLCALRSLVLVVPVRSWVLLVCLSFVLPGWISQLML